MFLGLPDPHPDPLVTSTDPAPNPSIIKQKKLEKPEFLLFCDFFDFLSLKNYVNVQFSESAPGFVCFMASRIRIRIR
jgi:hypothetical protein